MAESGREYRYGKLYRDEDEDDDFDDFDDDTNSNTRLRFAPF